MLKLTDSEPHLLELLENVIVVQFSKRYVTWKCWKKYLLSHCVQEVSHIFKKFRSKVVQYKDILATWMLNLQPV